MKRKKSTNKVLLKTYFVNTVLFSSRFKFQLDLITTNEAFVGKSVAVVYPLRYIGLSTNQQARNSYS